MPCTFVVKVFTTVDISGSSTQTKVMVNVTRRQTVGGEDTVDGHSASTTDKTEAFVTSTLVRRLCRNKESVAVALMLLVNPSLANASKASVSSCKTALPFPLVTSSRVKSLPRLTSKFKLVTSTLPKSQDPDMY